MDKTRLALKKLEQKMMNDKAKLGKLRSKLKPELVEDYLLQDLAGKSIRLSSLFGKKNELILIHNMGSSCPFCTMWADGFNGLIPHLEDRAAFVVESADAPKTVTAFKKKRSWKFDMVSSDGTSFRKDMGYADKDGDPMPGVSAFIKKNGKIYRFSDSWFGPGDNFCVTWDLFALLPGGYSNWDAKFKY